MRVLLYAAVAVLAVILLAGCHNTGRQVRKTVDSTHDLLLEGSY
jgi:predicted small secreted protein